MGSSQRSLWTGRLRWGRGKYVMGSALYYVAAVSLYRMFERPYVIGGIGILCGYMQAMLKRERRFVDRAYLRCLRRFERCALLMGKRRAIRKFNDEVWTRFPPPARRAGGGVVGRSEASRDAA
jgi:biofilm PGA synthesis N-glycosyltransferase PgaC